MKVGRVIGTMVCNQKVDGIKGLKFLIVRPLNADLSVAGDPFVATDSSDQAGEDDLVTYEESREAALCHDPWFVPVDHAVVGIISQYVYQDTWENP